MPEAGEFKIYVSKIPSCKECPFYIEDTNREYLKKDVYRCSLKGRMVTGQYGGTDIVETDVRGCPFEVLPCKKKNAKCPAAGGSGGNLRDQGYSSSMSGSSGTSGSSSSGH